jgi:CheY-like chemotaxis protein
MGRILLVEDTAMVIKAITRLLQQAGHDIVTAERGDKLSTRPFLISTPMVRDTVPGVVP